jgi:hypothetical protein
MRTRFGLLAVLFATLVTVASASEDWPGDAGKAESVKNLPSRDFENAKTSGMPLCIYFFDPNMRPNNRARHVEMVLGNLDLREKLKAFLFLKIRTDGSDVRGWPMDLREPANKSASVVFISSDGKQIVSFDKMMQVNLISVESVATAAENMIQYEKRLSILTGGKAGLGAAKKEEKKEDPKKPPVIEAAKVPGLSEKDSKPTTTAKRKPATPADE